MTGDGTIRIKLLCERLTRADARLLCTSPGVSPSHVPTGDHHVLVPAKQASDRETVAPPPQNNRRPRLCLEPLEARECPAPFVVDTVDDVDGPNDGVTSLREAIRTANDAPAGVHRTITFADNMMNKVVKVGIPNVLDESNTLELKNLITIDGLGKNVTIERDATKGDFSLFNVKQTAVASIIGLKLQLQKGGGNLVEFGGAVVSHGALTLQDCIIRESKAGYGGGVAATKGTLNVVDTTITENNTWQDGEGIGQGGGVYIGTEVTSASFSHASIVRNTAKYSGGGIWVDLPKAGNNPTITLNDTWVLGNTSASWGGGIGVRQTPSTTAGSPQLTLTGNTWIAFNKLTDTTEPGGGLYLGRGSLLCDGVTFESNTAHEDATGAYTAAGTAVTIGTGSVLFVNDTWTFE